MAVPEGYVHFTVRPLEHGDERALSEFYTSLSDETRFFFEPYRDTSPGGLENVVHRAVTGEDLSFAVVDGRGGIFAHIYVVDIARDVPHVGIGLRDDYQGLGLGRLFFGYLLSVARHKLGKKQIGLTVLKHNRRGITMYRTFGFEVVKEVTFREPNDSYEMWMTFRNDKA